MIAATSDPPVPWIYLIELALSREYPYYDPIYMLPESGQAWWRAFARSRPSARTAEVVRLAGSGGSARQDAV